MLTICINNFNFHHGVITLRELDFHENIDRTNHMRLFLGEKP